MRNVEDSNSSVPIFLSIKLYFYAQKLIYVCNPKFFMYNLILSNQAEKKLDKLKKRDKKNFEIIMRHLENLTQNPKFYGKPLTGNLVGLWSYRTADFRIIYEIEENKLIVFVIEIEHRKNVYER